jgi:hypothetical protein
MPSSRNDDLTTAAVVLSRSAELGAVAQPAMIAAATTRDNVILCCVFMSFS